MTATCLPIQANVWQLTEDTPGIDAGAHVAELPDGFWRITYGLSAGKWTAFPQEKLDPAKFRLRLEYPNCPLNLYIPPEAA